MMARARYLSLGVLTFMLCTSPAEAQEDVHCVPLDEATQFCGLDTGWRAVAEQPVPGTTNFLNQEYIFAVTIQRHHGATVSPALYDRAIEAMLTAMDQRTDQPPGTHRADSIDFFDRDGMEGRRLMISSEFDGHPAFFMVDILYSDAHAWIFQTGHVGAIAPDRLARVHARTTAEVQLDP